MKLLIRSRLLSRRARLNLRAPAILKIRRDQLAEIKGVKAG